MGHRARARKGPWVPVSEEMWKAGPLTLTCKLTEPSWLHSSLGRSVLGEFSAEGKLLSWGQLARGPSLCLRFPEAGGLLLLHLLLYRGGRWGPQSP